MNYLNRVFMIGNLTRDPEIKQTSNGQTVLNLGIASNRSYKNKQNGVQEKETCFIDVSFWGQAVDFVGQTLKKGSEILVDGRLKFNSWDDQSGNKHNKYTIIADRIIPMFPNPAKINISGNFSDANEDVNFATTSNSNQQEQYTSVNQQSQQVAARQAPHVPQPANQNMPQNQPYQQQGNLVAQNPQARQSYHAPASDLPF